MAKKKSKATLRELWPGRFTATHAVVALSLMLNVALLVVLIAMARTNVFDEQIAKRGAEILCSDDYQNTRAQDSKALLQYTCAEGSAHKHFLNGYNEYRRSMHMQPITD